MADETLSLGSLADGTALGDVTEAPLEAITNGAAACRTQTHPADGRLAQVWSISGALFDYPERFATRELAQAAAEIAWCNENDPSAEPAFEWDESDETGVYEAYIGDVPLEWQVAAQPLIWSRPADDTEGGA